MGRGAMEEILHSELILASAAVAVDLVLVFIAVVLMADRAAGRMGLGMGLPDQARSDKDTMAGQGTGLLITVVAQAAVQGRQAATEPLRLVAQAE